MRQLLNTLYVTTPNAYLSKDGTNVVVSVEQVERFRIPVHNIESIVIFSYMGASPGLMKLCADSGVSLTFLSPSGKYIGRFKGHTTGNILLRKRQHELWHDEAFKLKIAKDIIAAKVYNSRNILLRFVRDHGTCESVEKVTTYLDRHKYRILNATSSEQLRGLEGECASAYFSVFDSLILSKDPVFRFSGRNRRPPKDATNALLSFAYSLLANDVTAALETVGLDPYLGIFHALRPGRASLALDLMEELRAYMADRFALSLINRGQLNSRDFMQSGFENIMLTDDGRKTFLSAWQTRKKDIVTHPYTGEKIPLGLLPYAQAQLLARHLRGDLDAYPVFLVK